MKYSVAQQTFFHLWFDLPGEFCRGECVDTDKFSVFRMMESNTKCVQSDRRLAEGWLGIAPEASTAVEGVPDDAVPARAELKSDLMHATGAECDSN